MLFLAMYVLVYGAMNAYLFLKCRSAWAFGMRTGLFLALIMAGMIVAPIFVHLGERLGWETASRILAWIGYLWMGFVLIFLASGLAVDVYQMAGKAVGMMMHQNRPLWILSSRAAFFTALALALVGAVIGFVQARTLQTPHVVIRTEKLPPGTRRLRIVQISDVHLGLMVRASRLRAILKAVRKARPDLLVSTGDLVDGQMNRMNGLAAMLASVHTPLGKYACTGNHEFYAGIAQASEFTDEAGFALLRNETVWKGLPLALTGVDDPAGRRLGKEKPAPESSLLSEAPQGMFRLLLKHRPDVPESGPFDFDLQLSGHTHGGQIFPYNFLTRLSYRRIAGLYKLGAGACLFTSRGSGTWGPPFRLFEPPQVVIIDLVRESGPSSG
ncbi:MAG: metallophosphoesterase [Acidobacteriota bacterium]